MSLLSVSERGSGRITDSVIFVETYKDRLQRLIGTSPGVLPANKSVQPIRAILLQDCYGNQDALAVEISRNGRDFCTIISLVGAYATADKTSTFKLQLFGVVTDRFGQTTRTLIGTSDVINVLSGPNDLYAPLAMIDPSNPITPQNTWITLGNPYVDDKLIQYGNVAEAFTSVDPVTSEPIYHPNSSPIAMWAIQMDQTMYSPNFYRLELLPFLDNTTRLIGVLGITAAISPDLISPETTVVTDIYGRTQQYPWQAGTIVTCLDYADIGYGIIGNAPRNLNVTTPTT